ncbi:response regulator [Devosia sp.]|uniref:response regulator n=1 Tax=Devosia sp. TaxID=1871048 RepID=UPI001B21A130|nr:response regulator [Devosia sp.]MBO9590814.1 response regulator transcription factor [Devosia sp.]
MTNQLILIIEDDIEIVRILQAYFERDGYRTVSATDPLIGLSHHQRLKPDLVVLDVKMPKMDGFETLAALRNVDDTPVIMVTALAEDLDKLQALRLGADDYVVKPFNPLEVVARARAILRRSQGGRSTSVLRLGPLSIDSDAMTVHVGTGILGLTRTEYRLLEHMARSPNRVFERSELIDACLPEGEAMNRTVDSHMSNLRRKLGAAGLPDLITGIRGVGYRLDTPNG